MKRVGIQNNVAGEAISRKVFGLYTFWGYNSCKWCQKNFKWICWGRRQSPLLATSLHAHKITIAIRKQSTEKTCTQHTLEEQMLTVTADPLTEVLTLDNNSIHIFVAVSFKK